MSDRREPSLRHRHTDKQLPWQLRALQQWVIGGNHHSDTDILLMELLPDTHTHTHAHTWHDRTCRSIMIIRSYNKTKSTFQSLISAHSYTRHRKLENVAIAMVQWLSCSVYLRSTLKLSKYRIYRTFGQNKGQYRTISKNIGFIGFKGQVGWVDDCW